METSLIKCRKCSLEKPNTEFFKATKKEHFDKICKSCKHEEQQERRKEFKQWCVDYKGGKCSICSYNKCIAALDFHHLDPNEKDFGVKNNLRTKEKAIKEMDKCILDCSNCHREIHAAYMKND